MAWTCTGRTNIELIENMVKAGMIPDGRIANAMKSTDRAKYVPRGVTGYEDSPQTIGFNATISAPHMHAYALSSLAEGGFLEPGCRVLDVGCGSGYLTSVIHRLVSPVSSSSTGQGLTIGIDHLPGLVDLSRKNITSDRITLGLKEARSPSSEGEGEDKGKRSAGGVEVVLGDGRQGWEEYAPYDAIHVGAAAPTLPQALVDQLASPGRMFVPIGTHTQEILRIDKDVDGRVTETRLMGVRYVPLTDAGAQWPSGSPVSKSLRPAV